MNELKNFTFEDQQIRVLTIEGEPWFVGKDVAEVLGYSNSRKAIADHVDSEDKGVTKCYTLEEHNKPQLSMSRVFTA